MIPRLVGLMAVMAVLLLATAFSSERPDVPENLKTPANEELVLVAHATGVQIYVCQAGGSQEPSWVLKAPEAQLTDDNGKNIIHHFAGPSWQHVDGSLVTGKMVAKHDAPKADAIPWLLLSAANQTGDGVLSRVTAIQRIHTDGGLPPKASECTPAAKGHESKSPYSADYYFYAPGKQ